MQRRSFLRLGAAATIISQRSYATGLLSADGISDSRAPMFRHAKGQFVTQALSVSDALYFKDPRSPQPLRKIDEALPSTVPVTIVGPPEFKHIAVYTSPLASSSFEQSAKFIFSEGYAGTVSLRVKIAQASISEIWAFGFNGQEIVGNGLQVRTAAVCSLE